MKPLISVIIPVYNSQSTLVRCIESVLTQTIIDRTEIILVDDESADSSVSICRRYTEAHPNITLIEAKHGGISHSRNTGFAHAKGEFISFVDSDDFMEPLMLEKLLAEFSDDEIDAAVTSYNDIYGSEKVREGSLYELAGQTIPQAEMIKACRHYYSYAENIPCYITNYLIRKDAVVPFDEDLQFMEDAEFLSRMLFNVRKIRFTGYHLYNYYYNVHGVTKSKENVYSNIIDLTKAGRKIAQNLKRHGIYDELADGFNKMQCMGTVNKLMLIHRESLKDICNVIRKCLDNNDVRDVFAHADISDLSFRMKLVVWLFRHAQVLLLAILIKCRGIHSQKP